MARTIINHNFAILLSLKATKKWTLRNPRAHQFTRHNKHPKCNNIAVRAFSYSVVSFDSYAQSRCGSFHAPQCSNNAISSIVSKWILVIEYPFHITFTHFTIDLWCVSIVSLQVLCTPFAANPQIVVFNLTDRSPRREMQI